MKQVRFPSANNIPLKGDIHLPNTPNGVGVILLHGLLATKDLHWFPEMSGILSENGYTVLRFDFAGNGKSGGTFEKHNTYEQAQKDVQGAIQELKKHSVDRVFLIGHSYGGAVAFLCAGFPEVVSVVGFAPVTNPSGVRNRIVKRQKKKVFLQLDVGLVSVYQPFIDSALGLTPESLLQHIHVPICIIHGTKDKALDYTFSEEFYKKLDVKDKAFHAVKGADHVFMGHWNELYALTQKWLQTHIDLRPKTIIVTKSARFCPKCGTTDGEFIGLFCKKHFLENHPHLVRVPDKLEVQKCKRCGKMRLEGSWVEGNVELVKQWVSKKVHAKGLQNPQIDVELKQNPHDEKMFSVLVHVKGEIEDQKLELSQKSILFLRSNICNDDMLVSSDYYEGIIQVRFGEKTNEKIRAVQDEIDKTLLPMQRADSKAVVVNWVSQKHGFDAWVVSHKAAKAAAVAIVRKHKGTLSVSHKLIGLDIHTSKTKNRATFLVRIP